MRRLLAGLTACVLVSMVAAPVVAQEPPPSPPPWFGGHAKMPEYGFAVTVPDGWIAYDMTGDVDEQVRRVAATLSPDASEQDIRAWSEIMREQMKGQLVIASEQSTCGFVAGPTIGADLASFAAQFYTRQLGDDSVVHVEPPEVVDLLAGPAHRITYGRQGEEVAIYLGEELGSVVNIWCAGPERPDDDWLSIAEGFEWLPVPVQRVTTPRQGASFEVPAAWQVITFDFLPDTPPSSSSNVRPTDWVMTREPGTGEGCSLFTYTRGPGTAVSLDAEVAGVLADYRSDPGVEVVKQEAEPVRLPAGDSLRVRVVSDEGRPPDGITHIELYVLVHEGDLVKVQCAGPVPHRDRWLSIAKTFEFLPAEE